MLLFILYFNHIRAPTSPPTYSCVSILDIFICRAYVPQSSKIGCFPFPHAVSIYTSLGCSRWNAWNFTRCLCLTPHPPPPVCIDVSILTWIRDVSILTWIRGLSSFISDVAFTTFRYKISILVDYFLILLGDIFSQFPDLIAGKKS